jgi:hypothetical protein
MDGNLSEVYHFFVIGFPIPEYLLIIITFTRFICEINVLAISECSAERYWHRTDRNGTGTELIGTVLAHS